MKKINESFVCLSCKKDISPAPQTCRNHCPYCFTSLHIDQNIPWDRWSTCHGMMFPREYNIANGKTRIKFECVSCWHIHHNKASADDNLWELDMYIGTWKEKFSTYSDTL